MELCARHAPPPPGVCGPAAPGRPGGSGRIALGNGQLHPFPHNPMQMKRDTIGGELPFFRGIACSVVRSAEFSTLRGVITWTRRPGLVHREWQISALHPSTCVLRAACFGRCRTHAICHMRICRRIEPWQRGLCWDFGGFPESLPLRGGARERG